MVHTYRTVILAAILASTVAACDGGRELEVERDLAEILGRDTLVALTTYNSTSYFIYRAEPMGFEFDLLREFAEEQGVELRVEVLRNRDELLDSLAAGAGDVVAARFAPTDEEGPIVFTHPLYRTRPALVQRSAPPRALDLPEPVDTLVPEQPEAPLPDSVVLSARLLRGPEDLVGQEVHVRAGTYLHERIIELSDSITGDIEVVEVEADTSVETLIRSVAQGQIDLAISPENVARLNSSYYNNVVVRPTIGPPVDIAWAVRENSPALLAALNAWIGENEETREALYEKYYLDRRGFTERVASEYLTSETGRLSPYDDLFRRAAPAIGWDWRLLASQAFQESRFNPTARSWAGAQGLLQLMPGTAREVGVSNVNDPEENVAGAVRYLEKLQRQWRDTIADPGERLRFVLASYNAGAGHVEDARRMTAKQGDDPDSWQEVAYWLLQLSKRQYYTDPVVMYGFVRGLEPVTYVGIILERFDHYREMVPTGGG